MSLNKDKGSIGDFLKGVIHDLMDKIDTAREEHSPTIPMAIVALVLVAFSNRFFGKFAGFLSFAGIILMLPLLLRKSEENEESTTHPLKRVGLRRSNSA